MSGLTLTILWRGRLETLQWHPGPQPGHCQHWALRTGEITIKPWRGEFCAELHAHDQVLLSVVGRELQPTLDALARQIAEIRRLTEPEPEPRTRWHVFHDLEPEPRTRSHVGASGLGAFPRPSELKLELERAASDPAPDRYVDGQIEIQISGSARVTVEVYDTDTDETLDARVALAVGAAGRADAPAAAEGLREIERTCKEHAESARARVRDDGAQHALGAARAYEHTARIARDLLRGRRGDQR